MGAADGGAAEDGADSRGDASSPGRGVGISGLLERCRFPAVGSAVACGLSGGPDSSALVALASRAGLKVTAWHVNHKLRPSAADDEAAARCIASLLGAGFEARSVSVAPGSNLEARAREARYAALPDDVMVGHTADDRAETVLFNIGRGGGSPGPALDLRASPGPFSDCAVTRLALFARSWGFPWCQTR